MPRRRFSTLAGAVLALSATCAGGAASSCPERLGVAYGDTLASIAQSCGISVETLRQANPGLTARNLQAGTFVVVPDPALPSPRGRFGNPLIEIAPPITVRPLRGASPTVILPPEPPPVQRPLFGDGPGQLSIPLPPGHDIGVF